MELATSAMEQVWQRLGVSGHNPVRQFQIVYCSWLAIAMLFNMRNHCRFYRWFSSSRCLIRNVTFAEGMVLFSMGFHCASMLGCRRPQSSALRF